MMIECEVKNTQTGESIENTRREGGDGVGTKVNGEKQQRDVEKRRRRKRGEMTEN